MNGSQVDIADVIESRKIGGRQILLLVLCLIVVALLRPKEGKKK